jgi:AraC family transcriptional regulator
MENKLFVKNMVCDRCIMAVKQELEKSAIPFTSIDLGEISISGPVTTEQRSLLKGNLEALGFELIEDKTARTISAIKRSVLQYVRDPSAGRKIKFSVFLAGQLNKDYHQLSNLFSFVEGTTIEQYLIHQKIERVKELLVYDELTLSQIADKVLTAVFSICQASLRK